ncbi:riboflavin synthase [Paenibacillus daejeonensis]|uniref:riboflavin synthase n=1 Tax=Paenibacillus daejeonensis TaxID=135193 RepID=UPI000382CEFD|nr:riboflavin synthase [Paenibacillus daejeonensis]
MFTGLIEEIGRLKHTGRQGEAMLLTIEASTMLEDVKLGDSIAVNGVCLTVVAYDKTSFTVDVMPQTYRHSNLKDMRSGHLVNLERAMLAGGRFGGHIVQGHVDTTGVITERKQDANAVVYRIMPAQTDAMRYIIPQGSITLDGISLTVVTTDQDAVTVSIIPHTLKQTALQYKGQGDTVNIETDVLGKYMDHLLHYGSRSAAGPSSSEGRQPARSGLSAAFLSENGFM